MMKSLMTIIALALLAVFPARGEGSDSLQVLLQRGDSCIQRYNTFEAHAYYRQFLDLARQEENPNAQLLEMMQKAEEILK